MPNDSYVDLNGATIKQTELKCLSYLIKHVSKRKCHTHTHTYIQTHIYMPVV